MTQVRLEKINITINLLKIVSMWGASAMIIFKLGIIYQDIKVKFSAYDTAVIEVADLKKWRTQVTAYYTKPTTFTFKGK